MKTTRLARYLAPFLMLTPLFAATALSASSPPVSPAGEIRVAVLDAQEVAILSERDLSVVATFPLPEGWTEGVWASADGTRLTVLKAAGVLRAKAPADLTIFDLESLEILGQHELNFHFRLEAIADDGKTGLLVFKGCKAKKDRPARPPSLVGWDADSGTITGRTSLDGLPDAIHLLEETGRVVLAFHGESGSSPAKRVPGRLEVFDASSLARERIIPLPGPVVDVAADNRSLLFALDRGTDRKKPEETLASRVYVVDPARSGLVADLEIGVGANLLSWDDVREVFYVVTRPRKAKTAAPSLQMIQGNSVVASIQLASRPHGVVPAPDRSRYYVLEADGITVVSRELATTERRIPLPGHATAMLFADPPSRAFVSYRNADLVSAVDLGEGRVLADITTGRAGKKIALATAQALSPAFGQGPYTVPDPETSGFLSPDGQIAFLKNTQTQDLTAVDTQSLEVLDKIPGSMPTIVLDGTAVVTIKVKDLVHFDLETRTTRPEVEVGRGFSSISPSARYVWTGVTSGTAVFDLEACMRVKLFEDIAGQIVFVTSEAGPAPSSLPVE